MNLEVELISGVIKGKPPPSRLPAPRLIKIFIVSERDEFVEERKQLLQVVGPELQSIYDDMGIEVLLVDMHYRTVRNPDEDPHLAELFLKEISAAHQHSRGCFMLHLVGENYTTGWAPTNLNQRIFKLLVNHSAELLDFYQQQDDYYALKASREETIKESWQNDAKRIQSILTSAADSCLKDDPDDLEMKNVLKSTCERQLDHGLALDPKGKGIVCFIKETCKVNSELIEKINCCLPKENILKLNTKSLEELDPNDDDYLTKMSKIIIERIEVLVNASIESDPEIKSRKKMVQEIYAESLIHLSLLRELKLNEDDDTSHELINKIKSMLTNGKNEKHGPIIIRGDKYSGKSGILNHIYNNVDSWLNCSVLKIVRLCNNTPRSAYSLELLRLLCQHIGFLCGSNDGNLPQDSSFHPFYLNNWFNKLLRDLEEKPINEELLILIDDLHKLHPLESDIVIALSWLPLILPKGVHLVITVSCPIDNLKLTPIQKEHFKKSDILLQLNSSNSSSMLSNIDTELNHFELLIGSKAANRIGSLLTCTEYGLSETELLELIMPTDDDNYYNPLLLTNGHFNFANWCLVKHNFINLLKIRVMSGRLLINWRFNINDLTRKRYLANQFISRPCHSEIATLFFAEDCEESEEKTIKSQVNEDAGGGDEEPVKETPFQSIPQSQDITYTLRHVEEAWLHLLRAGDSEKLKKLAVCAFDFLLAAVQMISVSYLRCVLEHSRRYLLERDLELVYYTIRNSSDALTRDPLQLGAQLISWLRPVVEDGGDMVSRMITSAMAWCDGYVAPLLVPLNGWLQSPLPQQIKTLNCPQGVKLFELAPSGQHVIIVPPQGDPELWHIMSEQLVHTFKGHSRPILCLAVTQQSQYLLTGSEDTSIIVWDMKELKLKQRICEHIAPVLTLTLALNNSTIISGGEDSRIIITSLLTGEVIMKIDHHRGPVTTVRIDNAGDVLVSGSSDGTVCLWSLENFTILNTIVLPSAVLMLDISGDSVFLLTVCEDEKMYLRSLATGTEIHTLRGHQGIIRSVCLARDCRRAIAGSDDGKISIFDIHSGKLMKRLTSNITEHITCVKVTEKDDFLLTAGGNRLTFTSFRGDSESFIGKNHLPSRKESNIQLHTSSITCLDISRDGAMAVTGAIDSLVNLWQLNTHELILTLEGHIASVTCIAFSPSGLFVASGSEDKTVRVWGLTLGLVVATFKHQAPVTSVLAMLDGRQVVSSDRNGNIRVWAADTGTLIQSVCGPGQCFAVTTDMRFTVCGTGDNQLKIISLGPGPEEKYQISHSQDITCLIVTPDSNHLITGSRDMSLKVWQLAGGKLSQVLVGHTDHVTCVAVAVQDKSIVVSGSRDANLIVWDINTGDDLHTLTGHLSLVTCVRVSGDGTLAVSGSEDKTLIVWDTKKGSALSSIVLHIPIISFEMSTDCSRLALHLLEQQKMPILCLHNTPAQYVKLPSYVAPRDLRPSGPKRPAKRLLKKEVSLDTYTWQRKYGHITSGSLVAAVEDRLRRRFSVSASMEEISKAGLTNSPSGLGPEQAALAQSQHFDQLEALWNKQSPPPKPRTFSRTLSKQSSLQHSRISDSEEEDSQN